MFSFQTKNPKNAKLGKFWRALDGKILIYFGPFGIFYRYLVDFTTIWYILCSFGTFFRFWSHVPRKIWQPWLSVIAVTVSALNFVLDDFRYVFRTFRASVWEYVHGYELSLQPKKSKQSRSQYYEQNFILFFANFQQKTCVFLIPMLWSYFCEN
jgi:hypothetical protein